MDEASAVSSMSKLDSAKRQTRDFIGAIETEGDDDSGLSVMVGVSSFSETSYIDVPLTNDPSKVQQAIIDLDTVSNTNIYAGLNEGIEQLSGIDAEKVMVFLSDGLSNAGPGDDAILDLARQAAAEDITIYTIGFGPASSIDEELLEQIADITGGTYSHEDSGDISSATVGLFATMMEARLAATSDVLLSTTGQVAQGSTADAGKFDVTGNGDLQFYLYWPGSVLDLLITDPAGQALESGYPGFTIDESSIPVSVKIVGAQQGTWNVSVYGREVSMAQEPYYAAAAFTPGAAPIGVGGGGGTTDNSGILIFGVAICAIVAIVITYAVSRRRSG